MLTGLGAGMGMGMAGGMIAGPWGQIPAQQPRMMQPERVAVAPPPPPQQVEHAWHVAENGKTEGPYSLGELGRMAADGNLTRESYVWTAGQDGWKKAGEVDEVTRLFTILPPPPPA